MLRCGRSCNKFGRLFSFVFAHVCKGGNDARTHAHEPASVSWGGAVDIPAKVGTGHEMSPGIPEDTPNCCLKVTIYYVSCRGVLGAVLVPLANVQIGPSLSLPRWTEGKRVSERSHRPRVVASIPRADFICRMSTSRRRGGPRERGRRMWDWKLAGERETEGKREKERREVHGTRDWTRTGPNGN